MPLEIRLLIYSYLVDDGGHRRLRVKSMKDGEIDGIPDSKRARYLVVEGYIQRRCYETTYTLATESASFHLGIMGTCRRLYAEVANILYARHSFDFGADIAAVIPFFSDRTAYARAMISEISIQRRVPILIGHGDGGQWSHVARYLAEHASLRKLRLVVGGGRPAEAWEGPQELSKSDFELLAVLKHECIDWATDLARIKDLDEVEIVPEIHHAQAPRTPSMTVFAAFSASIEKGLSQYIRERLGIRTDNAVERHT
ncbi:uncharacterized protein E0L32_002907 [Thyridium curvatum]|uniref:DUF7730 domain-containing protein n=1 Tax=Thyridium curvatum TaxID=1093900 RepID=A0A507BER1_9PEZI|nr:uncharacterized protein E0L32_002907 [Thyridium curvatum]TPX17806.1 hypothetical protein E0L32_002907 [Thyridium curvatum]